MKKLFLILILILSVGFVAAHGIYANMNEGINSKTYGIEREYDNAHFEKKNYYDKWDKGYSYDDWDNKRHDKRRYDKWDKKETGKKNYQEYVPHLRKYVKKSCYISAPVDRLFYLKC